MNDKDLKKIKKELKKSSSELFKPENKTTNNDIESETTLGTPKNLIDHLDKTKKE